MSIWDLILLTHNKDSSSIMKPYIHIHINRTGGTSIMSVLGHKKQHTTAKLFRQVRPIQWKESLTFAFIRNPYDRMVSIYSYRLDNNVHNMQDLSISFDDFIQMTLKEQTWPHYNNALMFKPCVDWISEDNEIIIDHIFRFEHFEEETQRLWRCLDLTVGEYPTDPIKVNASNRGPYQDYYTNPETLSLVREWFHKDIEVFDYGF